jgi:hypothetical protein
MPREIIMRHRTPHFTHVFSGDGYSSGYYSYLWSEVLDADAFNAFEETGDAFDPEMARKLKQFIYSAGNLRDPAEAYKAFRGPPAEPGGAPRQARARAGSRLRHGPIRRGPAVRIAIAGRATGCDRRELGRGAIAQRW